MRCGLSKIHRADQEWGDSGLDGGVAGNGRRGLGCHRYLLPPGLRVRAMERGRDGVRRDGGRGRTEE